MQNSSKTALADLGTSGVSRVLFTLVKLKFFVEPKV